MRNWRREWFKVLAKRIETLGREEREKIRILTAEGEPIRVFRPLRFRRKPG